MVLIVKIKDKLFGNSMNPAFFSSRPALFWRAGKGNIIERAKNI